MNFYQVIQVGPITSYGYREAIMKCGLGIVLSLALANPSQTTAAEPKDFASWREFFTSVAKEMDVEQTPDLILNLATDSDVENIWDADLLVLVRPNLFSLLKGRTLYNQLRGTSNNGPFYLLRRTEKGLHLVGRMEGNECKSTGIISRDKESPRHMFECKWHNSAVSYSVAKYETDGQTLSHVETYTVEDGKRKP